MDNGTGQDQIENQMELSILQGLLGQCNDTTEALIDNLQEDALYWKMEYIRFFERIVTACAKGSGDLYDVINHASGIADIAKDSIMRSESIM